MTVLELALNYIARGWNPVPIPYRTKAPSGSAWQTRQIDATAAPRFFNGAPQNIGIVLGPSSNGLTDIDLDCAEAIAVAPYVLPPTKAIFGRSSKRSSHWIFYSDLSTTTETAAVRYQDPKTKQTLLELRIGCAAGAQTVFPGSTHESGEAVTWEEDGEPAVVDDEDLRQRVRSLAAYTLLARHWPGPGSRHVAALALGGFLARAGRTVEQVKVAAEAIAKAANDPEWRDRKKAAEDAATGFRNGKNTFGLTALADMFDARIANKVAAWLDYDGANERPGEAAEPRSAKEPDAEPVDPPTPRRPLLLFTNMDNWDAEPMPEREWAVHDRIPTRQPTLFSGEGAVGKSIIELQLCCAHVLARDWLGAMPDPGPAIYLGAEDEPDELRRRLGAIIRHYGVTFSDLIRGGLHLASLVGEDALLAAPDRSGKIIPTPLYDRLLEAARDIKPKHIGIDTSADVYGGNEIDRSQVRQFVGMLRKLAIAANGSVVLLAHPSLTGINSGSGLSGSTGWHNSVRARMYMRSPKTENGENADTDLRELEFRKSNYSRLAASIALRYHNGVFIPEPSMSIIERACHERRIDDVFLAVLGKLIAQNRPVSPSTNAANYAPTIISSHPDGQAHSRKDYQVAMERLIAANRIHVATSGSPSRPTRLLALGPACNPNQDRDGPFK
jgi:RecA-family ATPase